MSETTDQSLIKLRVTTVVSVIISIVFAVWTISSIFWSFKLVEQEQSEQKTQHIKKVWLRGYIYVGFG